MALDLKNWIPVLPVRNLVIFPGTAVPVRVGRPKSVQAVKEAAENGKWIYVVAARESSDDKEVLPSQLYCVGALAKIEKLRGSDEEGYQVLVRGESRVRLKEYKVEGGAIRALGEDFPEKKDLDAGVSTALMQSLKQLAKDILALLPADTRQLEELVNGLDDLTFLSYLCAANLEIGLDKKQELLETDSLKDRVLSLLEQMQLQKDSLQVQSDIRDRLTHKMGKVQREAILRQHLNAIREELGESDETTGKDSYADKIEKAGMPEEAKKAALDELKRLEAIGNSSPESHVIRNYLDLLCAMPWSKSAEDKIDLEAARKVLDDDHYGLDKIKKRILQHLAVMKLKKEGKAPILLFVGPPGVGKTSLGQSIARALGRKFVRGSLGGVRDDAEIRGHRRTYIGAMPGRIIQSIKRAGENNPVFLLDEVDKLSRSFQGDPASALLEVLDPEQNSTFLDHYLDVPFDLSKTVFIATANTLDTIPGPLLDRMEVIELSGYTTAEKLHIAKNHLVPKVLKEHGLTAGQVTISDEALLRVVSHYTREAGVRDLQRHLAGIARAATEKVVTGGTLVRVESKDLDEMLGPERFIHEVAERLSVPGVVTGLAWTPQGGEILFIESRLMAGAGKLTLTGQLGDVMKESAQIALSLVRSQLPHLVPGIEYEKRDLHIHVPSGAIPKDGPSAGIAILTALASLYSGKSVDAKLAMTGEITLRGAVMPVGGVKEKVIAAHRAGVERILLPKRNERDLKDIPQEVRDALKIEFVETASEVLKSALGLTWASTAPGWAPPAQPSPAVA